MKKILSIVLLVLATVVPADAQVVQPQYVRQSKIALGEVLSNIDFSGVVATTTSKVWSVETFSSAVFTVVGNGGCSSQIYTWEVPLAGNFVKFGALKTDVVGSSFYVYALASATDTVGAIVGMHSIASNLYTCVVDLYVSLVPIASTVSTYGIYTQGTTLYGSLIYPNLIGGTYIDGSGFQTPVLPQFSQQNQSSTTPTALYVQDVNGSIPKGAYTSISPTNVTTVATVATMTTSVRATLQNNGTGAALCLITTNASATVDANTYSFSLSAATAVNDGSGSTWTAPAIPSATTYIRCAALSGTARISGFTHP